MGNLNQYDSVLGAKLLLALAYKNGQVLNVTKVQKLLYIIYGYYLSKNEFKIFEETPKAWPYGPVFPRTRKKVDFSKLYNINDSELDIINQDVQLIEVMEDTINKYSRFSAGQLSDWSHLENGPWDKTVKEDNFKWGDQIDDEYIKDYFSKFNF